MAAFAADVRALGADLVLALVASHPRCGATTGRPYVRSCRVLSLHRPMVELSVAEDRVGMAATADLTFPDWDTSERGPLEEFPSRSVQPTPLEDVRRAGD